MSAVAHGRAARDWHPPGGCPHSFLTSRLPRAPPTQPMARSTRAIAAAQSATLLDPLSSCGEAVMACAHPPPGCADGDGVRLAQARLQMLHPRRREHRPPAAGCADSREPLRPRSSNGAPTDQLTSSDDDGMQTAAYGRADGDGTRLAGTHILPLPHVYGGRRPRRRWSDRHTPSRPRDLQHCST